jgi:hypothetical protein
MEDNNQLNLNDPSDETPEKDINQEPILSDTPSTENDSMVSTEEAKEPSRVQLFMKKALTWLAVVAVAFLAGFITFYFTLYRPKVDQLDQVQTALTEAENKVSDLETQLSMVTEQRDALATADDYRVLLSIMTDIYAVRTALVENNTSAAKSALSDISDTLDGILGVIQEFDEKLAESLPQRLNLIRTNIDGNLENAIADCDLFIKDLRDIEKALYQ